MAITAAIIWGSPFGISTGHLGRATTAVLAVAILVLVLGVMVPLAIAVGSRAMPAPGYVQPLKLSSSKELMVHQPGFSVQRRASVGGVAGFVCSDWAHWGPTTRVTCTDDGFYIKPSHWPVVGRRLVPDLTVRWDQVDAVEVIQGERGADILVVRIADSQIAFGLWLGPWGSGRLAAEFRRGLSEGKESKH